MKVWRLGRLEAQIFVVYMFGLEINGCMHMLPFVVMFGTGISGLKDWADWEGLVGKEE